MARTKTANRDIRGARGLRVGAGAVLDDTSIGRIEEWVVSTLGDRARPSPDIDWRESLGEFTLAKRPEAVGRGSTASMAPTAGSWARFRLSRRRGIAIVSLTDQALIKEEDLAELSGDLQALVEAGHLRIVLDFFAVERLSSWAARTINEAVRACFATPGGSVKFSGLRPDIAAIFAMTGLDPMVAVYPDTATAVASTWPDLPDLRPLPVSILAALMRAEDARPRRESDRRARRADRHSLPDPFGRGFEDHPAMFGARLIVQDGPFLGKSIPIRQGEFVIGRGPDCQLKLGSTMVSRSHARIERRGGRFFLRDLSSTNGSRLNGRTLRDREVEIGDGDRLQFGPITFALSVGEATPRLEGRRVDGDREWAGFDEAPGSTEEFINLGDLAEQSGLKHEVVEGVLVVTPTAPELDDEESVDAFRDGLLALAAARLPGRVVINLTHVGHLSGRAIGALVAHHLRLDRSGGALRVCLANPRVALVLEQVKLGMFIDYHPTVDEAVIAAWPEPVAGRA
jgi:anti-anti-sigma factor